MNDVPSIVVDQLVKQFGAFIAVNQVSFQIRAGEIFGLLGPNGSGKSTVIRMLCGLLTPSSGSATVVGFDAARQAEEVRQHIGYMSQKFSLYNDLTAIENLQFFGGLYGVKGRALDERIAWAIKMSGLAGSEQLLTGELSGGWKQRLALGCAVLHRPQVLFLDEPTAGVDPLSRRQFWELIHQMSREGVTILITTHYMDEAEYCNRIALIDAGRLVVVGSPGELRRHELGGTLYELDCAALGAALVALREAPGVIEAAIFGDKLHVLLRDAAAAAEVQPLLAHQGIASGPPRAISPSLEDVFVQLVSRPHASEARA